MRVTKLVAENENLKQNYKQLYDSIKSSHVRSKEQCDDLIRQVNIKSAENSDLNASLQEKVLVITPLKDTVSKLKGKAMVNKAVPLHSIDPELLKIDVAPLAPKLRNNRIAHNDYLKHTQEETATLREIVENERLLNPLNTSLDYVLPLRKPIPIESNTSMPVVTLVYSQKSKEAKNTVSVSKSKINKSLVANKKEPNNSWGSTISSVPFSTIECRNDHVAKIMGYGEYKIGNVVQIVLWYLDSGCSKHMTGDRSQLINFVQKFLGTVKFGNDHVAKFMGYGDYKIGNVKFLRSKDEAPDFIIKFLKMIQVRLKVPVHLIKTDNETEFVNQMLREYYEEVGISHETSVARSPR
nr:integrase, catalytic region, zinc finger, CCHC-type, peptidase aspartic, catalytic [Tanacetum cinerariifolium]